MADMIDIKCPQCSKGLRVPDTLIGKLIRCKNCQSPVEVTAPKAAKTAKPAIKPLAKSADKPADAPLAFKDDDPPKKPVDDDDDEDNPKAMNVIKEDDVARCPFCAKELDPPDTKICLNCGYNLTERRRHESKKVYELTTGDYVMHLLPGVACIFVIFALLGICIVCGLNMRSWMTGSLLDSEEKNPITGATIFYIGPMCFNIWIWIISAWLGFLSGRFAIRRLILNWKPTETVKKEEK